jgi:hypothetical protein
VSGSTLQLAHSGASLVLLLASLSMTCEIALFASRNRNCRIRKLWAGLKVALIGVTIVVVTLGRRIYP